MVESLSLFIIPPEPLTYMNHLLAHCSNYISTRELKVFCLRFLSITQYSNAIIATSRVHPYIFSCLTTQRDSDPGTTRVIKRSLPKWSNFKRHPASKKGACSTAVSSYNHNQNHSPGITTAHAGSALSSEHTWNFCIWEAAVLVKTPAEDGLCKLPFSLPLPLPLYHLPLQSINQFRLYCI